MPTYEYQCDDCGHEYELFQSMKDDPILLCPACNKETSRRLFGVGGGIIFKGSGFYETDYKRQPEKKSEPAKAGANGKAESNGKSDAKPKAESKSESKTESKKSAASVA